MSTYKFSLGERVTARYSNGETIQGEVKSHRDGWSQTAYGILPDGVSYLQMFFESELTKLPRPDLAESPYTMVISDIDAVIAKKEQEVKETSVRLENLNKHISSLKQARITLTAQEQLSRLRN